MLAVKLDQLTASLDAYCTAQDRRWERHCDLHERQADRLDSLDVRVTRVEERGGLMAGAGSTLSVLGSVIAAAVGRWGQ